MCLFHWHKSLVWELSSDGACKNKRKRRSTKSLSVRDRKSQMYPLVLGMEASGQFSASVNVEGQGKVSKKLRRQCSKLLKQSRTSWICETSLG